ncbi:MAG: reprolysin-like metallopeptidase, partial [Pseudomonadota bacterium]
MHRLLLPALVITAALAFLLIDQSDSTPIDSSSSPAAEPGEVRQDSTSAWEFERQEITLAERQVSGLEQWPEERLHRIRVAERPTAERLQLDLGSAGQFEGPIVRRTAHGNGDETVLIRPDAESASIDDALQPTDAVIESQAVLTWGEQGLFGRIHHAGGLYLVHSDAAGTWLVDLNDERISVDTFDPDLLGDDARIYPEDRASRSDSKTDPSATAAPSRGDDNSQLQNDDDAITIDILFAYTPAMEDRYPGSLLDTRLNHLIAIASQTMVDSEVPIAVRLVGQERVNYTASNNNGETIFNLQSALAGQGAVAGLGNLASRRDQLGADIVAFTWPHDIETRGSCGVARFPRREGSTFDSSRGVHIDNDGFSNWSVCSDAVFTHELGHNLNAEHQRARSSGDDPNRSNYAFIELGRFHTIMGSFGTGDQDRYRRLDRFSNPFVQCAGQPCGSLQVNAGANNAAEITAMAVNVANYRSPVSTATVDRPPLSDGDQDGDGRSDLVDLFPFDPFDGQGDPNAEPALVFSPRELTDDTATRSELLVVSSGSDQVLAFDRDGNFRSVAVAPERVNAGPILSDFSDILVDNDGRITLLSSGDVRRYDRLSGRLIDVFLSSQRPFPNDLLSPFPRALAEIPNGQLVVLGDSAIERYDDDSGAPLTRLVGAEPTTDPEDWDQRLGLSLRAAAQWALKLYVTEATENRILRFSAASGVREADLAGPGAGGISDPRDLAFDNQGLLYL